MVTNPNWPRDLYGQDLSKTRPQAIQSPGGNNVFTPSLVPLPIVVNNNDGAEQLIVAAGTYPVLSTTVMIIVQLGAPGVVTLELPEVATRNGAILGIADWGGNATIDIVAFAGELIMGLPTAQLVSAQQGLGTGVSVYLRPITSLDGWVNI